MLKMPGGHLKNLLYITVKIYEFACLLHHPHFPPVHIAIFAIKDKHIHAARQCICVYFQFMCGGAVHLMSRYCFLPQ